MERGREREREREGGPRALTKAFVGILHTQERRAFGIAKQRHGRATPVTTALYARVCAYECEREREGEGKGRRQAVAIAVITAHVLNGLFLTYNHT
jgi:hypothetical protein